MKVEKRMCLRAGTFVDGDKSFTLERGKEYTVSPPHANGTITVFSRFWFRCEQDYFEPRLESSSPSSAGGQA